jgi:hypothetical protein
MRLLMSKYIYIFRKLQSLTPPNTHTHTHTHTPVYAGGLSVAVQDRALQPKRQSKVDFRCALPTIKSITFFLYIK